jgi:succinoglycan biosynthesis transport protein ExoP
MDSLLDVRGNAMLKSSHLLDPSHLVAVLRRNAAIIVVCGLVGGALAYTVASRIPKSYTASGSIAVAEDRMVLPELQGALQDDNQPDPMPEVHTEMQALSSRQLVQQVINELGLDRDPEFNGALRPPTFGARAKDWVKSFLPHGTSGPPEGGADDALFGAVDRALVISQDNRSLVIGIAFTAHDPRMAAKFVNTLVTDYIQSRADRRLNANAGASAVMTQRVDQVRKDIETIEQKMRTLRTQSDAVELRAGSVGQQQVEDLTTAAANATMQRSQIEEQYERAAALASSGSSEGLASVLDSPTISRLREQESEAASKVADLSMRYGPNWPPLRSANADLSATRRQISAETRRIVDSLATQLRVARAHEADVTAQLAAARHAGVASQNVQAELNQLQQDAATRRDLYRTLLERAEQTGTEPVHDQTPDVRVLSKAVVPGLPSAPNLKSATGLGGMSGALLACACALAFTRRGAVLNAERLGRIDGLMVIATIRGKALGGAGKAGIATRVAAEPAGEFANTLRMARTRLGQVARRAPHKIAFAGASSNSAAAAAAAAFARNAASDGQRVLLIDGDKNRHDMAGVLGAQPGKLEDVFQGHLDWRDAVVADRTPGLDLLLCSATGHVSPGDAVALENLLVEAVEDYDIVVLGAPAAIHADALTLARTSDVTVLVVDARSGEEAALQARGRLAPMSRSPLAAILFEPA